MAKLRVQWLFSNLKPLPKKPQPFAASLVIKFSLFFWIYRIFSEAIVTRINKNATANIESLMEDLEDLEVSVTNRKRKRGKTNTPVKKIKKARRRLFKETPSAKQFLQDETQISGSYKWIISADHHILIKVQMMRRKAPQVANQR